MTPRERAEKICVLVNSYRKNKAPWEEVQKAIIEQIEEAQREGFSAARTKAMGIVRDQYHEAENITGGEWLASMIEKMLG